MSDREETTSTRRFVVKAVGGGLVLLPVAGLVGCGNGDDARPAGGQTGTVNRDTEAEEARRQAEQQAREAERQQAQQPEQPAQPADGAGQQAGQAAEGELERLSEDAPQAVALGYKHDASEVNPEEYPRYEQGQLCSNCALYQAQADQQWGPCSIFPGKLVNADGWCNSWAPGV